MKAVSDTHWVFLFFCFFGGPKTVQKIGAKKPPRPTVHKYFNFILHFRSQGASSGPPRSDIWIFSRNFFALAIIKYPPSGITGSSPSLSNNFANFSRFGRSSLSVSDRKYESGFLVGWMSSRRDISKLKQSVSAALRKLNFWLYYFFFRKITFYPITFQNS